VLFGIQKRSDREGAATKSPIFSSAWNDFFQPPEMSPQIFQRLDAQPELFQPSDEILPALGKRKRAGSACFQPSEN